MLIFVLLPPDESGIRVLSEIDEANLIRHDEEREDDEKAVASVEYCLVGCAGRAHQTGVAEGTGCFCHQHVHRSLRVTMKKWPGALSGIAQPLGGG